MFILGQLFENDMLVLQETLIDRILNDTENILKNKKEISVDDFFDLEHILKTKYNINVEYIKTDEPYMYGQYIRPNIIRFYIPVNPKDADGINGFTMASVFLHEFSHYITDNNLEKLVKENSKNSHKFAKLIGPPEINIEFNSNKSDILKLLDYVLQIRERTNWAVSISLELNNNKIDNPYNDYKQVIIEYFKTNNKLKFDSYYFNLKSDTLKMYFQIIYFTYILKHVFKDNILFKEYLNKLITLRDLVNKYQKRIKLYLG